MIINGTHTGAYWPKRFTVWKIINKTRGRNSWFRKWYHRQLRGEFYRRIFGGVVFVDCRWAIFEYRLQRKRGYGGIIADSLPKCWRSVDRDFSVDLLRLCNQACWKKNHPSGWLTFFHHPFERNQAKIQLSSELLRDHQCINFLPPRWVVRISYLITI